jgi:hypothetical protein
LPADQFDPQQVQQAFAAWRTAWDRFVDQFSGTPVDALAQLPVEDRRKLVAERRDDPPLNSLRR